MPNANRTDASDPIVYISAHAADIAAGIDVRVGTIATDGLGHWWLKFGSLPTDWSLFPQSGHAGPLATLAALAALNATSLTEGDTVYVVEAADWYALDRTSTLTPDAVTVIAAVGGGYWVAQQYGRWEDIQGSIGEGQGASALTTEAFRDTPFLMSFMRHDQDDLLCFVFQIPHRFDPTKSVYPHLHVLPMVSPAAGENVRFVGAYAWSRPDYAAQPLPALTSWTPFTVDMPVGTSDGFVQKIVSLGAISPPSWARGSTCLLIYFRRNGTALADTYTTSKASGTQAANLGLISADVHYRIKAEGSITEIPT